MSESSKKLQKREISVTLAVGEQSGWMGSSSQLVPFGALWPRPGERTPKAALGLPEAHLGSVRFLFTGTSLHWPGQGLNRLWLRFKRPSTPTSATLLRTHLPEKSSVATA